MSASRGFEIVIHVFCMVVSMPCPSEIGAVSEDRVFECEFDIEDVHLVETDGYTRIEVESMFCPFGIGEPEIPVRYLTYILPRNSVGVDVVLEDSTVIEIPLTLGVVGMVIAPILAAVGAIAALASNFTIEIEKKE